MKTKKKNQTRSSKPKAQRSSRPSKKMLPPDNPLLRHEELATDRQIEGEDQETMAPSLVAAMAVGVRSRQPSRRKSVVSTVRKTAEMRLAALRRSEKMVSAETDTPVVASRRALSAAAPGGVELMAPVTGVSNWVQLGPTAIPNGQTYGGARVLVTGRVTAIVVDPTNTNTIYIGTAQGGVWKTTDGGLNWVAISDNEISLAIGALAMDPVNSQILYAGTGEGNFAGDSYYGNGVLKTVNGGTSWTNLAQATFMGARFSRLAVTPAPSSARLFAATGNGLYRSTNSGTNWSQLTGSSLPIFNATDVCIDPTTPATVYAAFWGDGIYKSTNAGAATPAWTKLAGGLPVATAAAPNGFTRIALGISPSSPQTLYALFANNDTTSQGGPPFAYAIDKFYVSTNGGTTWTSIPLPAGLGTGIGGQGFYCINVAVDPTTPDIVYLSAVSLWKAVRSSSGNWTITDIGGVIHPDNHALVFEPAHHLVLYAGNDGGIYKSVDGGATWSDKINEGPCITQFEFIDHHPLSDAVVFGGTQDNGTEQFRNSPVFNHAADGDGGFVVVDQTQPQNVVHTYYGNSPERSVLGGKWGNYTSTAHLNWTNVSVGIAGAGLFYPVLTLDQTNQNNAAFGTDRINLDASQGTGGWPTKVTLSGIGTAKVSAIHYVNSTLIYVGTTNGRVYRLVKTGTTWTATAIHSAPLPSRQIWDIATLPANVDTIILVMSGFGSSSSPLAHVWQGAVAASGASATWTNISGTGAGALPDIPVNALVIDPNAPTTYYIGTDVAVYRTTNAGATWTPFNEGLPNCAIFDLRLHNPTRLLRAGTHGRGLWERKLDVASQSDVDLFVRDNLMSTARQTPTPGPISSAFEDPLQYVSLGTQLWWWECADIKVDALEGTTPSYQMPVAAVDYVAYESLLQHRDAQRGKVNRVYVQLHNRGFAPATNVTVRVFFADATPGLPSLPANFWTIFPSGPNWFSVGPAKLIPSLSPTEPTVLEWDWTTPLTAATHTCLLVIMDSPSDPIPAANKILNVNALVPNEKRVGLKNLHIVDPPPGAPFPTALTVYQTSGRRITIRIRPSAVKGWRIGAMLPKTHVTALQDKARGEGWSSARPTRTVLKLLEQSLGAELENYDTSLVYTVASPDKGAAIPDFAASKKGTKILLVLTAPERTQETVTFTVVQEEEQRVVGGNTYVLRSRKRS